MDRLESLVLHGFGWRWGRVTRQILGHNAIVAIL